MATGSTKLVPQRGRTSSETSETTPFEAQPSKRATPAREALSQAPAQPASGPAARKEGFMVKLMREANLFGRAKQTLCHNSAQNAVGQFRLTVPEADVAKHLMKLYHAIEKNRDYGPRNTDESGTPANVYQALAFVTQQSAIQKRILKVVKRPATQADRLHKLLIDIKKTGVQMNAAWQAAVTPPVKALSAMVERINNDNDETAEPPAQQARPEQTPR